MRTLLPLDSSPIATPDIAVSRRWPAGAASLAIHAAAIAGLASMPAAAPAPDDEFRWERYRIEPMYLRAQVYSAALRQPPSPPAATPAARAMRPLPAPPKVQAATVQADIELPPLPPTPDADTSILRPAPPRLDLQPVTLPMLAFWSQREVASAKLRPRPFVAPGAPQPVETGLVLTEAPRLDLPNTQTSAGDLNIGDAPAIANPALPAAPAATAPLRTLRAFAPPPGAIAASAGDAANVIAIGPAPAIENALLAVPLASQGAYTAGGLAGRLPGPPQGGIVPPPTAVKAPGPLRVEHPRDGRFTFVVAGPSLTDAIPQARGLLSGRFVYNVYVQTGAPKAWLMQYCLPGSVNPASASAPALDAPYPLITVRPPGTVASGPRFLLVQGVVTPEGRFDKLRVVAEIGEVVKRELAESLAQWEFRPAVHDGRPALVEVLLIIPREAI